MFEVIFDYLHHSCTKQNLNDPVTIASYYRIFALLLFIQTIPPPCTFHYYIFDPKTFIVTKQY